MRVFRQFIARIQMPHIKTLRAYRWCYRKNSNTVHKNDASIPTVYRKNSNATHKDIASIPMVLSQEFKHRNYVRCMFRWGCFGIQWGVVLQTYTAYQQS